MVDILYRSAEMEVRRVAAGDGRSQVITFDPYHDRKGFDREGFGEGYFAREGITAIHLLTRDNDWFQYRELPQALALIREAAAPAERRLAYGSSMGGYAAIRFAGAVGAETALALSPQYSVDRRKAPFERRWMQDQRRIRFVKAIDGRITCARRTVIAYDPHLVDDRRHADAIAGEIAIERLDLPFAGHPVGAFLAEVDLLKTLVEQALTGTLDVAAMRLEAHRRRRRSPTWLSELAGRQPAGRLRLALTLAERAVALAPDHPAVLARYATRLEKIGAFKRAAAIHARALALDPIAPYRWGLGRALLAAGDLAGAHAVAELLVAEAPDVAGYHRFAAEVRRQLGDIDGAIAGLGEASRLAPRNWGYRGAELALRARRLFGQVS